MPLPKTALSTLVLFTLLSLSACSQHDKLAVAYHPWLGYVMPFLVDDGENQPTIEYIKTTNSSETMERIKNSKVDAGYLTLDEAITLRVKVLT